MAEGRAKGTDHRALLAMAILALALSVLVLSIYSSNSIDYEGVSWDFISHYVYAQALLTSGFQPSLIGTLLIEPYRAPMLIALLMVCIYIFGPLAIPACIVALLALFIYSLLFIAKKFSINPLVFFALAITPYIANFTFLYDGEDILSLSLIIITLALLKEKKVAAGATLALAAMSKYACLIFLPLLLYLDGNRDRALALAIFAVVTTPWLIINFLAWGSPIYSYYAALTAISSTAGAYQIQPGTVWVVIEYLVLPAAVALVLVYLNDISAKHKMRLSDFLKDLRDRTILSIFNLEPAFLGIAIVGWLVIATTQYYFVQERYAYFVFFGIALIIAIQITRLMSVKQKIGLPEMSRFDAAVPYFLFAASMALLLSTYVTVLTGSYVGNHYSFAPAVHELDELNMSNCSVVSNAWIYLDYYNVTAVSPYYGSYTSAFPQVVFNTTQGFYSIGAPTNSVIVPRIFVSLFTSRNFTVYVPRNFTCPHSVPMGD